MQYKQISMYVYFADIHYLNDSSKAKRKYIKLNLTFWLTTKWSSTIAVMYVCNKKYGNAAMKYHWKLTLSMPAIITKQLKIKQQK